MHAGVTSVKGEKTTDLLSYKHCSNYRPRYRPISPFLHVPIRHEKIIPPYHLEKKRSIFEISTDKSPNISRSKIDRNGFILIGFIFLNPTALNPKLTRRLAIWVLFASFGLDKNRVLIFLLHELTATMLASLSFSECDDLPRARRAPLAPPSFPWIDDRDNLPLMYIVFLSSLNAYYVILIW